MANKILENGLKKIQKLQRKGTVFSSENFEPKELTELKRLGFLKSIIRGWYHLSSPSEKEGETTSWYACYYEFLAKYLKERYKSRYCLNPEASLALHLKQTIIPSQTAVLLKEGAVNSVSLPFGSSLFTYPDKKNFPKQRELVNGLYLFTKEHSLCRVSPTFWRDNPLEIQILLKTSDAAKIVEALTNENRPMLESAKRVIAGLRFIGRETDADMLKFTYEAATGETVTEENPFKEQVIALLDRKAEESVIGARIKGMWTQFRAPVYKIGQNIKKVPTDSDLSEMMDEIKKEDMYHSLSIEGYEITDELIVKVESGNWNVDDHDKDKNEKNAMAARGYYDAFEKVKTDILESIAQENNPADVAEKVHQAWFAKLFGPSLKAGILKPAQLMGYRDGQVYIRGSMHTPLHKDDLRDAMETYFQLLKEEDDPFVKAVLGHHLFGFIHPYMDGNGRMARFIMNLFLVTGGYKWCVVTVDTRDKYMKALEEASVNGNIESFAEFIKDSM